MKNISIVVTGDICFNKLQWITEPCNNQGLNWQGHNNLRTTSLGGESLLLSELVRLSTNLPVLSPDISNTEYDLISSTVELDLFPKYNEDSIEKVYRVKRFLGFTGPCCSDTKLLPVVKDDPLANLVIIDDENNGFNSDKNYWPLALTNKGHSPLIIYKTNKPFGYSNLWYHLDSNHNENTIVVINSEDIRSQGVNISKSLSWEKTAEDFVWQLNHNPNLSFLNKCKNLVVPFGLEGCIYYHNNSQSESTLFFLPYEIEGGFLKKYQGSMYGLTSSFVAALARSIVLDINFVNNPNPLNIHNMINEGIKEGIVAAQNYFIEGFGMNIEPLSFPRELIFQENHKNIIIKENVQEVKIPEENNNYYPWYIINDKSSTGLAEISYTIVKNGIDKALNYIPIASFGKLKTVDRMEIENYRSINNLMREYISNDNTIRPLSIAVFGTPGSGKSYGVTEVATSIAPNQIVKLTFNLSQFNSTDELNRTFHRARDYSLKGKIPLLIIDEFDTSISGESLGWLKYFLAPMQDGVFREGDSEHAIGKVIFVFGGGTSSTFEEFSGENIEDPEEKVYFNKFFRKSKGLDFISRLRGYVNILGPNPISSHDSLFIIRRAMILRSLIRRKAPHLINKNRETQIDNGVLRAMLKVSSFKHETRSMEAILDMSIVNKAKKWEQSHLPSQEQLKLHVDEESFNMHLMHDAFFSEKIEKLAEFLSDAYNKIQDKKNPWMNMNEQRKNFYKDLARSIPEGFLCINYDILSSQKGFKQIELNENELETLALYEHTRWLLHKKNRGWKYGEILDYKVKTDPCIISYNLLPKDKKDIIKSFVSTWIPALASIDYTLTR